MTGGPAAVAETHSAVVTFIGDRAYKVKKPVDLGFLDFRDRATREAICHREVALNRRLAPDVYLGVADVLGPDGEPCDHLVMMRRMPADRRLSVLVRSDADVDGELERLARLLAAFHAAAERGPAADEAAGPDAVAKRWGDNTAEMRAGAGAPFLPAERVEAIDRLARRYLAGRRPAFAQRVEQGRACDGHGDLLADDVFCLDDGPRVLDCIEFDTALRLGDALADVAFLAMDLERLGRPDLAERFLSMYRDHAGDEWPSSLAHHHIAYRAQVRAKVTAIRAAQGDAPSAAEAVRLLDLALRHLDAGTVRLVVVGGSPGTGKSTLSHALGTALGAVVLRSDEIRKQLAGIAADQRATAGFGEGIYTAEMTAATYREMLRRALDALSFGSTVVLDASFSDEVWRAEAQAVGAVTSSDVVELRCTVAPEVAAERIRRRRDAGGDPSDATDEIAAAMAATMAPWPSARVVDMTDGPEAGLAAAMAAVAAVPAVDIT